MTTFKLLQLLGGYDINYLHCTQRITIVIAAPRVGIPFPTYQSVEPLFST